MPRAERTSPPAFYWIVSVVLLLWALGGASIYVAYFVETPHEFSQAAEAAPNREAYAAYVAAIPFWAIAVGIVGALARLTGAVGLLLRRAWALPAFIAATGFFLIALFRAFVLANVASVMSAGHIATEGVFVALSFFAVWFAHAYRARGILR